MNYTIITNRSDLEEFINYLPELKINECYYLSLLARKKYVKNIPEIYPHLKSDNSQLRRFVVSRKQDIYSKIKQLEVEIGAYETKNNKPIPQEALALYININPRDQIKATKAMLNVSADLIIKQNYGVTISKDTLFGFNIATEALSCIQKSVGSKYYFNVDIDLNDKSELNNTIKEVLSCINKEAVKFIETRGGIHVIIEYAKIENLYFKTWYQKIKNINGVDIKKNDNMIPVIGTYQGGFTPRFLQID